MKNKEIYILGINGSHNAAAALLNNGKIISCVQEERFTRVKNQRGYPEKAIAYCLDEAGITTKNLTGVYIGFQNPTIFICASAYKQNASIRLLKASIPFFDMVFWKIIPGYQGFDRLYATHKQKFSFVGFEKQQNIFLSSVLDIPQEKIHTMDHHTAHAYGAFYAGSEYANFMRKPCLAITCDGTGDGVSSKIFTIINNHWEEIASTPDTQSLGWLYASVTTYLGMKVNEHEYKVMGLAPYAPRKAMEKVYQIFKQHMWVNDLSIQSDIPLMSYDKFLEKNLKGFRFDAIAGGIQHFTEDILTTLVIHAIQKTNIHSVVLGGGVMMNIKANMAIANLPEVTRLFAMPSSGDESTAIGAAYYGYEQYYKRKALSVKRKETIMQCKPLNNVYLGPEYSEKEIEKAIKKGISNTTNVPTSLKLRGTSKYQISKLTNPAEQIAELLAQGKIVARFAGRMEFGARALGNRSILAHPKDLKVIKIINDQIKGRDFWMPFSPVILKERIKDYLINPKNFDSPFMMLAFQTTALAQKELVVAVHPYDYTVRPQILTKEHNPEYYATIKAFETRTGIGGLVNTSFNLHGEPIVCSPEDAISTFLRSGLEYLQMESFLLEKKSRM